MKTEKPFCDIKSDFKIDESGTCIITGTIHNLIPDRLLPIEELVLTIYYPNSKSDRRLQTFTCGIPHKGEKTFTVRRDDLSKNGQLPIRVQVQVLVGSELRDYLVKAGF
jgi:hypothetical protein